MLRLMVNRFWPASKNNKITNEYVRTIPTGPGDDYATGCLLDYPYFKENYKIIEIALRKQQPLDANPWEIKQIYFTASLDRAENIFSVLKKEKKMYWTFHKKL